MRPDRLYLQDMVEAADEVTAYLQGHTEDDFTIDRLLRSAVLHQLAVIGEAAARVSQPLRDRNPSVPWPDVISFRNNVVPAYFSLHWHTVWLAAVRNAPQLRAQVAAIIAAEFGDDATPPADCA